jgi:hypothetical protein
MAAEPSPSENNPPKAKRKSPSPINKKYTDEIELIRQIVPQAQKSDRTAALTANDWDPARITALDAKATALENAGLAAVGRTSARKMNTEEEEEARQQMLAALHPIRAGAKRKYRNVPDATAGRATYFVNKETNVSLERLLFIAGAVLLKLTPQAPATTPEDTLPGVTATVLATLTSTRAAYISADAEQKDTNSQKNQAHVDVVTTYLAAHAERIDLQLAADQAWTFHNPANSAIRRDFKIPPDRAAVE